MVNYEGDFEVIKTCFWLSLISIYCSLYLLQLFMEFCWFVAVGCSEFSFCFFFSLQISPFSSSSFVVKAMAKKNHEISIIRFLFPFFLYALFIGFLVSWDFSIWFQFWVCFSWYIVFLSSSFYIGLDFLFPFFGYAIFIGFLVSWDFSIWFQFWVFFCWYIVLLSSSFTLVFPFYKLL